MNHQLAIETHEGTAILTNDWVDKVPTKAIMVVAVHEPDPNRNVGPYSSHVNGMGPELAGAIAWTLLQHPGLYEAVKGMVALQSGGTK